MGYAKTAYQLGVLFEKKITSYYRDSYKGIFGKVQVEVLDYFYEKESVRPQQVANAMNIPKQHASKVIARLEELGLVKGHVDPADKRSRVFSLTEEGRTFVEEHIACSDENFEKLLRKLSPEEQSRFADAMETMVEILELI